MIRHYATATFASLSVRNYRLYFAGQAVSTMGTWIQKLAQAWLVLQLTDSASWLGVVVAAQQLPVLLLAPVAGTMADRYPKRTILLGVAACATVSPSLLCVLTWTHHINVLGVMVLAMLSGLSDALEKPARQSLPSELVPSHLLTNAVTLNNVLQDSGKALGPAVAAFLIAGFGLPLTFGANALSFVAIFLGLLFMKPAELLSPAPAPRARRQFREGVAYVRRTPELLAPICLLGAAGLIGYNFQVLLPLLGKEAFHGDAARVGFLMSALGLGAVIAGVALAGVLQPTLRRIVGAALFFAACFVATSVMPTYAGALIAVLVLGGGSVVFKTLSSTWLQLVAEPALRGRVMSLLVVALAGTSPLGAPLAGWLCGHAGVRWTFLLAGVGTAAAAVMAHVYLGRARSTTPVDLPMASSAVAPTLAGPESVAR